MNKVKLAVLFLISILAISGIAAAQENSVRVIVPKASFMDKTAFKFQGCTVVHELNGATVLRCPKGIEIKNAVEDRRYYATDMGANIQIDAVGAWAMFPPITGEGVTVAVLDSGIDTDHPELVGSIAGGRNFIDGYAAENYEDDYGHGTHVSGIITADGTGSSYARGVAPDAKIWTGKVLDYSGSGWGSDIAVAIEYVVKGPDMILGTEDDHIADIISMSLGGYNYNGENCDDISSVLVNAVNWANEQGVTVVVASGNDKYFVSMPACASGAIAVGAVDKYDKMAYFSNFGPSLDIVAPGVSIYSTLRGGGYASWDGTSMATPHVSGTVALMLEANPGLNVSEIKAALYDTATPVHNDSVCYGYVKYHGKFVVMEVPCTSDNTGAGIVNAYSAVWTVHLVCGNNVVEYGEECDDGNTFDGDGCDCECKFENTEVPEFSMIIIPFLMSLAGFVFIRNKSII